MTQLTTLDYVVMAIYFVVVLGIGWALRRMMRTSSDFFLSGRSLALWLALRRRPLLPRLS
jgi:SSS family solute:Na+ symporter